ncbi:leucyl-cystinyl aminopeptidase-like [Ochlerotatus camptorhynchus]|uniref:leucyl-cystinyl aminopeptidase-like n=1 Tax=Ochlerotatus camptorhynchus TaxID=644619 RepID=UPI0031E31506
MASPLWVILSLMTSMSPESKVIKLPRTCLPEHYELKIDLSNPEGFVPEVKGSVQIRVNCLLNSSNLTLNWKRLFIVEDDVSITAFDPKKPSLPGTAVKMTKADYQSDRDFLVLNVGQTLKKGSKYIVSVNFSKTLGIEPTGLYRSFYYDSTGAAMNWIVLTNLYPMNARTVFPCFDEPDLKATFNLTLIYSPLYNAISNLQCVENNCKGYLSETSVCRKFASQAPIAPYQLAFSINDYSELVETDVFGLKIEGLTSDRFDELDSAINYTNTLLEYYHDVLGVEYPSDNLTLVTVPAYSWEFSGGTGLLGVPFHEDDHDRMHLQLARGLLRQILTNRVTLESWTDLWIIEGLTWYFSQDALGADSNDAFDQCWQFSKYDALNTSFALQTNSSNATIPPLREIGQKTFCIFSTLANFIGKPNFLRGTRDFIQKYQSKSIDFKAFQSSFISNDLKGKDLETLFESWLTSSGVSVLNVSRNGNLTKLEQIQFGVFNQSRENCRQLKVVLNQTSLPLWIDCTALSKAINLNDTPIALTGNESSYFKVLYDSQTYAMIGKLLKGSNNLSTSTRVQLLNDVLDFAWMGYVNYTVALDLVSYLQNETEHRPWNTVLGHFDRIWYLLNNNSERNELKKFLQVIITPIYKHSGVFNIFEKLSKNTQKLHSLLARWACRLDLENCTASARRMFKNGLIVPEFLLESVIREGAGSGNISDWGHLAEMNQSVNFVHRAATLIKVLQVAEPHELIEMVLATFANNLNIQQDDHYKRLVIDAILDDVQLPALTLDVMLSLFGEESGSTKRSIIRQMVERITTEDDADILLRLIQRFRSDSGDVASYNEDVANLRFNLDWLKRRRDDFLEAINKNLTT